MELQIGELYSIQYVDGDSRIGILEAIETSFLFFINPNTGIIFGVRQSSVENFKKLDTDPTIGTTNRKFSTILMDPPWNERGAGKIKRGADKHYPIMPTPDIIRTVLQCEHWNNINENAHLYMWVTNNFLADGLDVMKAFGFKYVTNFIWVKNRMGLGQYFRGMHEICLFGTKGNKPTEPRTESKSVPSVVYAERGKHSAKPLLSYELIERRSHGPYLEIFARSERNGWTSWGNEV